MGGGRARRGLQRDRRVPEGLAERDASSPTWWEEKLWHLYDATDYAVNFYNCPVVAYNGEIDRQKQAADMMEKAHGGRGHAADARHRAEDARTSIIRIRRSRSARMIDAIAERGRDPYPRKVRFTTWTLRL